MNDRTPDINDVEAAAARIDGKAIRTPLLTSPDLDRLAGGRIFLKPECLQRTGSFKFRGAYNAINALDDAGRAAGIVACSSGNHAQGIAAAAALHGCKATIVMPSDAPALKLSRTRGYGAEIVLYDRAREDREAVTAQVCERTGGTFVHPYENPFVIAGQGTAGLEIAQDLKGMGQELDTVLVCTGGGGLTAGVALAVKAHFAGADVYAVEPLDFDDYARSLESGQIVSNAKTSGSVCDAILTPAPGDLSFAMNTDRIAGGLRVSDEEALKAVAWAFENLKLVVEPGGAVALAALLFGRIDARDKTVAVVLSGGNIDPAMLERALATERLN